jgi:CPA2 family monovalent cation:H+ antiporter-2
MLFNPNIVLNAPLSVLATVLIIVGAKAVIGYGIVRLFRHSGSTALMIAASRAQIGEFSFILAGLGVGLTLLPEQGRDLILAGAIISILMNPLFFVALDHWSHKPQAAVPEQQASVTAEETPMHEPLTMTQLRNHVVLVGHGRVGSFISAVLREKSVLLLVIEHDRDIVAKLREQGVEAIAANAADPAVISAANFAVARCLLVAIPDAFEGGQVVEQARAVNATLPIIARAHSQAEIEHLKRHGASVVVVSEHEIAKAMIADVQM